MSITVTTENNLNQILGHFLYRPKVDIQKGTERIIRSWGYIRIN